MSNCTCGRTTRPPLCDGSHALSEQEYQERTQRLAKLFKPPSANEHGYCPNCKADMDDGFIWEYFYRIEGSEEEADRIAKMYGATRTKGKWGRKIALYDMNVDRTVSYQCPDCDHIWPRD